MPSAPRSRQTEFTDEAEDNLDAIEEYISQDSPQAARRLIERIRDTCFSLAEQPFMGVARPEFNRTALRSFVVRRATLRSFVVRNTPYIIFYYPTDDGVQIAYVRHGSRDLTILFDQ